MMMATTVHDTAASSQSSKPARITKLTMSSSSEIPSESTNKPELDFFMPNSTNEDFIEKKKSIQIIPLNKPKFQLKQLNNSAEYYNQKLSKFSSFGNN